jgi:VWFA-related protein
MEYKIPGGIMYRSLLRVFVSFLAVASTCLAQFPQEQHEVLVRNIVVHLRAYDGDSFVDNLTIDDLELFEDGEPQKIQGLYLALNKQIARVEAERDYVPYIGRSYYFLFQITEFNPRIGDALEYFFTKVFHPDDSVLVMTPYKNYTLSKEFVEENTTDALVRDMTAIIRRDAKASSREYSSLITNLKRTASAISGGISFNTANSIDLVGVPIETRLSTYRETLQKLEELRFVDEKKFLLLAGQLKRLDGQKNVFFFYEREYRPELQPMVLRTLQSNYNDNPTILGQINDLFLFYRRDQNLNTQRLQEAFADSSILFNLIYLDKSPVRVPSAIIMRELSGDVFTVFSELASSTGGVVETSHNPTVGFEKASEAAGSYYLLYYSPENYVEDGKFRKIEVRVKDKNYRITHRFGYFAK